MLKEKTSGSIREAFRCQSKIFSASGATKMVRTRATRVKPNSQDSSASKESQDSAYCSPTSEEKPRRQLTLSLKYQSKLTIFLFIVICLLCLICCDIEPDVSVTPSIQKCDRTILMNF